MAFDNRSSSVLLYGGTYQGMTGFPGTWRYGNVSVLEGGAPPVIAITSPAEGATIDALEAAVSGTASAEGGLGVVMLSADGANWTAANGTTAWWGTVALREGATRIYARATDLAGQSAVASVNVTAHATTNPGPVPFPLWTVAAAIAGLVLGILGLAVGIAFLVRARRSRGRPPA